MLLFASDSGLQTQEIGTILRHAVRGLNVKDSLSTEI